MHRLFPIGALMTASGLISDSTLASDIVLPDSLPQQPIFGESTSVLVRAYPGANVADIDGDGIVTDRDFRLWVSSELLDRLAISDTDNDGFLTASDEVDSFTVLLDKLSGDINGDGVKDSSDVSGFLDLYVDPDEDLFFVNILSADIDLDGNVTSDDFNIFLQAFDLDEIPDSTLVAVDLLANIQGTLTHLLYSQGHVQAVSSTWPGHEDGISRAPAWVPANHDFAISRIWTHLQGTSQYRDTPRHEMAWSEAWPPNHTIDRSYSWFGEHEATTSSMFDRHSIDLSRLWPSGHERESSQAWNEHPNVHLGVLSRLWPPDHEGQVSNTLVPSNHSTLFSQLYDSEGFPPEDYPAWPGFIPQEPSHSQYWSSTWPDGHNVMISEAFFPPNHGISASASWANHSVNTSFQWPSNHLMVVSNGWPSDPGPAWPANHGQELSATWDDPAVAPPPGWSLPPLLPPGHSVSTTAQEWIPIFRNLFPNLFPD